MASFKAKCAPKMFAVVDNLTVAVSVIIHSIVANINTPDSVIVMSTLTYNAVKNAINYGISQAKTSITVLTVDIPFPLVASDPNDALLALYRDALSSLAPGTHIALACLDHLSSLPCLRFPVRALVTMLKEEFGTREVLVDGAHGPGQLDVAEEVPHMGADYYVANLHKVLSAQLMSLLLPCLPPYAPSSYTILSTWMY